MTQSVEDKKVKVAVGCDSNATDLKEIIIDQLENMGYLVEDFSSEDPVYAKIAYAVGEAVAANEFDRGILICGTGIGMCIAANKVPGVYAALCADAYSAERAIKSNNTNVLAIGAFTTGTEIAKQIVKIWMESKWETGTASEPKVAYFVEYAKKHHI